MATLPPGVSARQPLELRSEQQQTGLVFAAATPAPRAPAAPKPAPTPVAAPTIDDDSDDAADIAAAIARMASKAGAVAALAARVSALENKPDAAPTVIRFEATDFPGGIVTNARPECAAIVRKVAAGFRNFFLTGPAGSGKSTLTRTVAAALGIGWTCQSFAADASSAQLRGRATLSGTFTLAEFAEQFDKPGVYCLDELDTCPPEILVGLNEALSSGILSIPDHPDPTKRIIRRHPQRIIVATANTIGKGATAEFCGRSPIDAATMDRFVCAIMRIEYDADLETSIATHAVAARILERVRAARTTIDENKIRGIVLSTRAIFAAQLMACGNYTEDQILADMQTSWDDTAKARVQL